VGQLDQGKVITATIKYKRKVLHLEMQDFSF